jgi:hypothetical protein
MPDKEAGIVFFSLSDFHRYGLADIEVDRHSWKLAVISSVLIKL